MKIHRFCGLMRKVFVFIVLFFSCLSWTNLSPAVSCEGIILNLDKLAQAVTENADLSKEILSLKDSKKEEDQIQFINHLKLLIEIEALNLPEDFAENYLKSKIRNKQVSFKVRKKALYTFISWDKVEDLEEQVLSWITDHFSENEQVEIVGEISNWIKSDELNKRFFIFYFLCEFLEAHIGKNVQFSFQSIVFNILGNNIELKIEILLTFPGFDKASSSDKRVINYLIESIDLEQIRESTYYNRFVEYIHNIFPSLNKKLFQKLTGDAFVYLYSFFKEIHKNWVTLKQFLTIPDHEVRVKKELAPYLAPKLNQSEVQSLEGKDLKILFPYLRDEQKGWLDKK